MLLKSLFSFLVGGILCVFAQILIDKTSFTPARILVFYVVLGVFLGAVGVYEPLFELSGCGASVPLTGFGANIAKGVKKAVDEKGIIGALSGAFTASSVGCTVALGMGFLSSLFSRGKSKRL
jgi:stage V sporulation protein AE